MLVEAPQRRYQPISFVEESRCVDPCRVEPCYALPL